LFDALLIADEDSEDICKVVNLTSPEEQEILKNIYKGRVDHSGYTYIGSKVVRDVNVTDLLSVCLLRVTYRDMFNDLIPVELSVFALLYYLKKSTQK
jgi:hypothetical protein